MSNFDSNKEYDNKLAFDPVMEAKVKMSLAEAEMSGLNVQYLKIGDTPGVIGHSLTSWVRGISNDQAGKFTVYAKTGETEKALEGHNKYVFVGLNEAIKIRDFNEILVVGSAVSIFDANGKVFVQREKQFIDSANRMIRSLNKITGLIDLKDK